MEVKELEKMEKEIKNEGKFSIRLPETVTKADAVPLFEDALKNNIDPKDIVFYSLATGILKYQYTSSDLNKKQFFHMYWNTDNISVRLEIVSYKQYKKSAKILSLSTKADVETKNKMNEKWSKELQKRGLIQSMNMFEKNIQHTKELIEKGVNKELEEMYFAKLAELKTNLERLLFTINDKLEAKK